MTEERFTPVVLGVVALLLVFAGMHVFSSYMVGKAAEWNEAGMMPSLIQQFAASLALFWSRWWAILAVVLAAAILLPTLWVSLRR